MLAEEGIIAQITVISYAQLDHAGIFDLNDAPKAFFLILNNFEFFSIEKV